MSDYRAPLEEITFALETVGGLKEWSGLTGYEEAGEELVAAVLEEAGKLASEVIAPTNKIGDEQHPKLIDGGVRTPDAFKSMHQAFVEGGWSTLSADPELGGQGLPATLSLAVNEMLTSANMAYSLQSLLTTGAIEAIHAHGSKELKEKYLPNMVSAVWSGAMNLTEPSAGSDVGALRSKATQQEDGTYLISGQKIFITWGDHDLSDNVIHLVLARLPDAPEGTKGVSMFLVPKIHVNDDGSLGASNDVRCVSLEHKLGIHGSPTCVMSFGDEGKCVGYLVGEENKGMAGMFTMMNHARIGVGVQGVAIAERAYQQSVSYALDRIQSAAVGASTRAPVAIINHPDVRRMLMTMRATTEAARAITYRNVWAIDRANTTSDTDEKKKAQGEADLLTPISKAYSTDIGVEAASLGVQVHGGMGFIEETGAAQHYRDSRIAPIYEGTNGIQALDLVGRKFSTEGGMHWRALIDEMRFAAEGMDGELVPLQNNMIEGVNALGSAAAALAENGFVGIVDTAGAATPYLRLFGTVLGAHLLAQQAKRAEQLFKSGDGNPDFLSAKISTAKFFIDQILPQATALLGPIQSGASSLMELKNEQFSRS